MPCRRLLTLTAGAMLTGFAVLAWFAIVHPVVGGLPGPAAGRTDGIARAAPSAVAQVGGPAPRRAGLPASGSPGSPGSAATGLGGVPGRPGAAGQAPAAQPAAPGTPPTAAAQAVPGRTGARPGTPQAAAAQTPGAGPDAPQPGAPDRPGPPAASGADAPGRAVPAAAPPVPQPLRQLHTVAVRQVHRRYRPGFRRRHRGGLRPVAVWHRPAGVESGPGAMRMQVAAARQVCARTEAIGMLAPWTAVCHWLVPR